MKILGDCPALALASSIETLERDIADLSRALEEAARLGDRRRLSQHTLYRPQIHESRRGYLCLY